MRSASTLTVDTITKLDERHAGHVIVAASHGGVYAGYCAAKGRVLAVIFNDAGGGLDQAGIGSLAYLQDLDIPAATASHETCRIGDGADMEAHGVISHVNPLAGELGCQPGERVADCARKMQGATPSAKPVPPRGESRQVVRDDGVLPRVVVMDSLSLVSEADAGAIVIAASHGALLGSRRETGLSVDILAGVFCDAGVGKDEAGVSRLSALDGNGIAAVAVSSDSARIGDGQSVYRTGIVSHMNRTARERGANIGMTVAEFIRTISDHAKAK